MKLKSVLIASGLVALSGASHADVGVMVGVGYTFGGAGPAVTVKLLSNNRKDRAVGAAGVSFYPYAEQKFGADLGAGYKGDHAVGVVSWDFVHMNPEISGGWASTRHHSSTPPPAPVLLN